MMQEELVYTMSTTFQEDSSVGSVDISLAYELCQVHTILESNITIFN